MKFLFILLLLTNLGMSSSALGESVTCFPQNASSYGCWGNLSENNTLMFTLKDIPITSKVSCVISSNRIQIELLKIGGTNVTFEYPQNRGGYIVGPVNFKQIGLNKGTAYITTSLLLPDAQTAQFLLYCSIG